MPYRLTKETKAIINSEDNNGLAANVADAMGIKVTSLRSALVRDTVSTISFPVLKVIADFCGKQPDELIEEYDDDTEQLAETNS